MKKAIATMIARISNDTNRSLVFGVSFIFSSLCAYAAKWILDPVESSDYNRR